MVPLCNYTLQPATLKVLETFPEAILWKPFQLLRRILNDVIGITKVSLQCQVNSKEQVKISWSQVRIIWECSSVATLFLAKKSRTKTDRCAGAYREGEATVASPFFGAFPSARVPKTSICISLFAVSVPVNYTCEFRKRFEAATYEHETYGLYISNNKHDF
jgi:hypothetical protein